MPYKIRWGVMILLNLFICGSHMITVNYNLKSYGNFSRMVHTKQIEGVANLHDVIPAANGYAVGAIQNGSGEITIIDNEEWLDYGKDGIGNSINEVPADEETVLLVTAQVADWREIKIPQNFDKHGLFEFILAEAKQHGLDIQAPFPFLLQGSFESIEFHVINGINPKFEGHGSQGHFFNQKKAQRDDQKAVVIGFYSAELQGVYTHPGESWHLHVAIKGENIGAHVDDIVAKQNTLLKLPIISN